MRKRLLSLTLSVCMLLALAPQEACAAEITIYVAPTGSDETGDGSISAPFATLQYAIDAAETPDKTTIYLRDGTYNLNRQISFNDHKSGLTIENYNGEDVTLSGAHSVQNSLFQPVSGVMKSLLPEDVQNKVVCLNLTALGMTAEDFPPVQECVNGSNPYANMAVFSENGIPAELACYPNGKYSWEWLPAIGKNYWTLSGNSDTAKFTYKTDDIYAYGFMALYYMINCHRVTGIDTGTGDIQLVHTITNEDGSVDEVSPLINFGNYVQLRRAKLINVYQALDTPGEYYLDRDSNMFYYYPRTNASNMDFAFYSSLNDLSDEHLADGTLLTSYEAENMTFRGITFTGANAGIGARNANNWLLENCTFTNMVNGGWMDGAANTTIRNCEFYTLGSSGFSLTGTNSTITNCTFHDIGFKKQVYCPAVTIGGTNSTVEHCTMYDLPFMAVSFSGKVNIRNNDIYDVCQDCGDMAAIYTYGEGGGGATGTVIEKNYIHDCDNTAGITNYSRAVYLDTEISGVTIKNNIFAAGAAADYGVYVNAGSGNIVQNNLFIDLPIAACGFGDAAQNTFTGNACLYVEKAVPARMEDVVTQGFSDENVWSVSNSAIFSGADKLKSTGTHNGYTHYKLSAAGLSAVQAQIPGFVDIADDTGSDLAGVDINRWQDKLLQSISIDTMPTKTEYYDSEQVKATGMVVRAHYSDGTSKIIDNYTLSQRNVYADMAWHYDSVNMMEPIYVSYTENDISQKTYYLVHVADDPLHGHEQFHSLTILHKPNQLSYYEGETIAAAGLQVSARWIDGEGNTTRTEDVTSACTVSPLAARADYPYISVAYADGNGYMAIEDIPITVTAAPSDGSSGDSSTMPYTLSFHTNGGSAISSISNASGATIDLTSYKPTKTGYNFDGWYSDSDLTAKVTSITLTSDTTVYAKWTANAVIPDMPFVDVSSDAYYKDAVVWAVDEGITEGTSATTFSPNGICTRAQAVTFLWRANGSPAPKTTAMPFHDVPAGSYYYNAVLWSVDQGIIKGTSATTFSPNMNCSRAHIVTMLWRSEGSKSATVSNPFADVNGSAYYADAVLWAVSKKVTEGTSATTFSPDDDCTRAQIVTFIYRDMK